MTTHSGACHCRTVRFEVDAPRDAIVLECNCSICAKLGYLHLIVDADAFRLLEGEDALTDYRFGSGVAKHSFCRICGVKPFYVPRSHPDGVSVNLRCVDREHLDAVRVRPFDGQNWESARSDLGSAV